MATLKAMRLEEVGRQERATLVHAALASLQQLRLHLVDTLSALHESSACSASAGVTSVQDAIIDGDRVQSYANRKRWGALSSSDGSSSTMMHIDHSIASEADAGMPSRAPSRLSPTFLPPSALTAQWGRCRPQRGADARTLSAWLRASSSSGRQGRFRTPLTVDATTRLVRPNSASPLVPTSSGGDPTCSSESRMVGRNHSGIPEVRQEHARDVSLPPPTTPDASPR